MIELILKEIYVNQMVYLFENDLLLKALYLYLNPFHQHHLGQVNKNVLVVVDENLEEHLLVDMTMEQKQELDDMMNVYLLLEMDDLELVELDLYYFQLIQLDEMLMMNHLLILHVYIYNQLVNYFHDPNELCLVY